MNPIKASGFQRSFSVHASTTTSGPAVTPTNSNSKMANVVLATLACLLALAALSSADTFDGVDVDAVLKNPDAVKGYVNCILGKGECNDSSKRLKDIVPNALLEKCSKCTDYQKRMISMIAHTMSTKNPQQWETVLQTYDPKKEHRAEIAELIKAASVQAAAANAANSTAKPVSTTAKPKAG